MENAMHRQAVPMRPPVRSQRSPRYGRPAGPGFDIGDGALDREAPDSEPPGRADSRRRARWMTQRYKNLDFLNICSRQVREMYEHWAALRVYRLVGTREVESRGADPTGQRVADAYFAANVEDALENYTYVATERAVLYDCERVSKPGNRYMSDECLFLPFTRDGERVGQVLVYSHYEDLWSRPPA